jgi:hypothetical protein
MNRPLTALHSIGSLSELDILGLYGASPTQPEKTLMFAVLLDAVECFQKYAGREANRLFKDTDEWIFEDDHEWPFSFINICEAVDIDPKYLRKGLSHWKKRVTPEVNARCLKTVLTRGPFKRSAKFIYEISRGEMKPKFKSSPKRDPHARSRTWRVVTKSGWRREIS